MSVGHKVPKIRFKGFNAEWKDVNFASFYRVSSGYAFKAIDYVKDGVAIINGEAIQNGEILSKNLKFLPTSFRESHSNFLLASGDIVLGLNRPVTNGLLKIARIPGHLDGSLLYQRAGKITFKSKINLNFTFVVLEKEILLHTQSESVGSDQPFISTSKLNEWEMLFPGCSEEKKAIGNFFQKLDNLISQHQQKHNKLSNIKKAMLEKMFPKQGETVPEIRFKGFSGEWEEKGLGTDVADIIGGGTPSTAISEFWDGDIDWYSPTEIGKCVYANGSQKKITALGLENSSAKILPAGNTVLFTSRAGIGDMAILTKSGATNQGFQSFVIKEGFSPYFLYSAGRQIKEFALKHASGSTFLEISGKQLGRMKIVMPSEEEQTAIGNYFQKLDTLINQHQQQITKLNNIKQACLSKMFV